MLCGGRTNYPRRFSPKVVFTRRFAVPAVACCTYRTGYVAINWIKKSHQFTNWWDSHYYSHTACLFLLSRSFSKSDGIDRLVPAWSFLQFRSFFIFEGIDSFCPPDHSFNSEAFSYLKVSTGFCPPTTSPEGKLPPKFQSVSTLLHPCVSADGNSEYLHWKFLRFFQC